MKTKILKTNIDVITMLQAIERTLDAMEAGQRAFTIYTVGPEIAMYARKDKDYAEVLNAGDLVIPDGIGVVLASKLNKAKLPERVGGCDFCLQMFARMKDMGKTAYFLGGAPGVAETARQKIQHEYPGLEIVGVNDGYFDADMEKIIIKEINNLRPDLLLVGTGFPRQENWIHKHKDILECCVVIGVGGSLDVYAGNVKRAPRFWVKFGLEWLYRLLSEPRKRFKRQLVLPLFVLVVLWYKISGKGRRG